MIAQFEFEKGHHNEVIIHGREKIDKLYTLEDTFSFLPGMFRYSDTVSINFLVKYNSDGEEQWKVKEYGYHTTVDIGHYPEDKVKICGKEDGTYKIIHIIMPTTEWLKLYLHDSNEPIDNAYSNIYVFNPYDQVPYKYLILENRLQEVDWEEILLIRPMLPRIKKQPSTISKAEDWVFLLSNLEYCYYLLCRDMIDLLCDNKCLEDLDNDYNYKIWKLLYVLRHIIHYLLEQGRYNKAQGYLENLFGCDTVCKTLISKSGNKNFNSKDCGCSKR